MIRIGIVFLVTLVLVEGAAAQGTSTLSKFGAGPRAGQTQDYAPMAPVAVGTPCHDGAGSTGTVVAPATTQTAPGPSFGPGPASNMSTLCRFNSGTRAGQTQNYAPMAPVAVGTPCHDGAGSTGTVVAQ